MVHRETGTPPTPINVSANISAPNNIATNPAVLDVVSAATLNSSNATHQAMPSCLKMTSKVRVQGPDGRSIVAWALLDSGSHVSLISNQVAQTLQLPRQATSIKFSGAQDTPLQGARSITRVSLCAISSNEPVTCLTAAIVPRVTCNLPLQGAAHVRNMPHIDSLTLADPTFLLPGKIDLLLGCDAIPDIMEQEHIAGPKDAPIAVRTVFGWAILEKAIVQRYCKCNGEEELLILVLSNPLLSRVHEYSQLKA